MAKISISKISEEELTDSKLQNYYNMAKKEILSQDGEYGMLPFR